jgi:hypothetical protein
MRICICGCPGRLGSWWQAARACTAVRLPSLRCRVLGRRRRPGLHRWDSCGRLLNTRRPGGGRHCVPSKAIRVRGLEAFGVNSRAHACRRRPDRSLGCAGAATRAGERGGARRGRNAAAKANAAWPRGSHSKDRMLPTWFFPSSIARAPASLGGRRPRRPQQLRRVGRGWQARVGGGAGVLQRLGRERVDDGLLCGGRGGAAGKLQPAFQAQTLLAARAPPSAPRPCHGLPAPPCLARAP